VRAIPIEAPAELFFYFERLRVEKQYIFRGQSNIKYKLEPYAFRKTVLQKRLEDFPVNSEEIKTWFTHDRIRASVKGWLKIDINQSQNLPWKIERIFNIYIHIMRYNYFLSEYLSGHLEKRPQIISSQDKSFLSQRPKAFWAEKETFIWIIENSFSRWIECRGLDGKILIESCPDQDLITGMDETFPQHYDLPTAALDWTYNPYKALYFALGKNNQVFDKEKQIYRCTELEASHFYIFAYRQLKRENSPIYIKDKSSFISNPRVEAQEGTFTYFSKICSFYLLKNRFPLIEDYDNLINEIDPSFELIKFSVKADISNRDFFRKVLIEKGINESMMMPELPSEASV
jgi:hypothetical protein